MVQIKTVLHINKKESVDTVLYIREIRAVPERVRPKRGGINYIYE